VQTADRQQAGRQQQTAVCAHGHCTLYCTAWLCLCTDCAACCLLSLLCAAWRVAAATCSAGLLAAMHEQTANGVTASGPRSPHSPTAAHRAIRPVRRSFCCRFSLAFRPCSHEQDCRQSCHQAQQQLSVSQPVMSAGSVMSAVASVSDPALLGLGPLSAAACSAACLATTAAAAGWQAPAAGPGCWCRVLSRGPRHDTPVHTQHTVCAVLPLLSCGHAPSSASAAPAAVPLAGARSPCPLSGASSARGRQASHGRRHASKRKAGATPPDATLLASVMPRAPPAAGAHCATREEALAEAARSGVLIRDGAASEMNFGPFDIPAELALLLVLPHLPRRTDGLLRASLVCRQWHGLVLALRELVPACAADIGLRLRLAGKSGTGHDGEFELWRRGDAASPPMRLYCHNVLSPRPTEFVSLDALNFSFFPAGGAAQGSDLSTTFTKLRVCPWQLLVKTNDYTWAIHQGGPLQQTYWNGQRQINFEQVPFATARDAAVPHGLGSGTARIDLSGTGFAVDFCEFRAMGCSGRGVVFLHRIPEGVRAGFNMDRYLAAQPPSRLQTQLFLVGGGYAGRVSPRMDRTRDEAATDYMFDDEGNCGGWVLPLWQEVCHRSTQDVTPPSSDEDGFTAFCAINIPRRRLHALMRNDELDGHSSDEDDLWLGHVVADAAHRAGQ
jgi:hypothetical protein